MSSAPLIRIPPVVGARFKLQMPTQSATARSGDEISLADAADAALSEYFLAAFLVVGIAIFGISSLARLSGSPNEASIAVAQDAPLPTNETNDLFAKPFFSHAGISASTRAPAVWSAAVSGGAF